MDLYVQLPVVSPIVPAAKDLGTIRVGRDRVDFEAVLLFKPLAPTLLVAWCFDPYRQLSASRLWPVWSTRPGERRKSLTSSFPNLGDRLLDRPPPVQAQLLFPLILVLFYVHALAHQAAARVVENS
jgi:hypothetical protein